MRDFHTLNVWKKAHNLTLAVYHTTGSFPPDERDGLVARSRHSSAAIPAHIAQGCGQSDDACLASALQQAMGAASELEYNLLLAHDLHLLQNRDYALLNSSVGEVKRMLTSFIQRVRSDLELEQG